MNYFKDWTRLKYGRNPEEKVGYLWSLNERIKDLKKSFKEGFVLFSTDRGPTEIEYDEEDTVDDILIRILYYLYIYDLKYDK